jgi:hypothetical protein
MIIRIKKNADGRTSLSCTRADGSTTWQTLSGGQAAFFPRHDLTHYAVETVLGHRRGFYGLVASGWELTDFGKPWPRGRIPLEALLSETIVGLLDLERGTGDLISADDINCRLTDVCTENGATAPDEITEDDLARVRRKRGELFAQWEAVKPGNALELPFDPGQEQGPRDSRRRTDHDAVEH